MRFQLTLIALALAPCASLAQQPAAVMSPVALSADSDLGKIEIPFAALIDRRTANLRGADKVLGRTYTVAVGETVFSEYDYTVTVVAKLRSDFDFVAKSRSHHVVPATELIGGFEGGGFDPGAIACTIAKTDEHDGKMGQSCFIDRGKDGTFDEVMNHSLMSAAWTKLPAPIPYRLYAGAITNVNSSYELVYLGMSGTTLRLAYREYRDELARPAFTTELTYSLEAGKPNTIAYKGLKIDVDKSGNAGITFRVNRR